MTDLASASAPASSAPVAGEGATVVVKVGGSALDTLPGALALAPAGGRLVIVHGGGPQISSLMRRRGIEPRFVEGRRVTDLPALACVRMALAGVSDELAEGLEALGARPATLRRGEVLEGRRRDELGLVGRITTVHTGPLEDAWRHGRVPLVAPLALDEARRFLNVNADDAAAALATALAADELVFLSDVPGVLDEHGRVVPQVRASRPPAVAGGMLPKLAASLLAVDAGVGRVRIGPETVVTR
jgi:acetylglutamate kinase